MGERKKEKIFGTLRKDGNGEAVMYFADKNIEITEGTSWDFYESFPNAEDVKKIVILTEIVPDDMSFLSIYRGVREIVGLDNIDTRKITDMSMLFFGFTELRSIAGVEEWDVSNVTDMSNMFWRCFEIKDISPLARWDLSKVENMENMFNSCESLLTRTSNKAFESWDVSNVKNMSGMFWGCNKLCSLDGMNDWDTSNVENMQHMFDSCGKLHDLDGIAPWDVSRVVNMVAMFSWCSLITSTEFLTGWDMSNVREIEQMFFAASALENADALLNKTICSGMMSMQNMLAHTEQLNVPDNLGEDAQRNFAETYTIVKMALDKDPTFREYIYAKEMMNLADDPETLRSGYKAWTEGVPLEDIVA